MTPEKAKIFSQYLHLAVGLGDELLKALVECEKPIEKVLPQTAKQEKRFLNIKELAERFGVSERTISNLQNEGLPTIRKFGDRVLFDFEDVLIWAKDKEIKGRRTTKLRVVR